MSSPISVTFSYLAILSLPSHSIPSWRIAPSLLIHSVIKAIPPPFLASITFRPLLCAAFQEELLVLLMAHTISDKDREVQGHIESNVLEKHWKDCEAVQVFMKILAWFPGQFSIYQWFLCVQKYTANQITVFHISIKFSLEEKSQAFNPGPITGRSYSMLGTILRTQIF